MFIPAASHTALPYAPRAMFLLASTNIESSQPVSVARPTQYSSVIHDYADLYDKILTFLHYNSAAPIMQKCNDQHSKETIVSVITYSATLPSHYLSVDEDQRNHRYGMTRKQIRIAKYSRVCRQRGRSRRLVPWSHWRRESNAGWFVMLNIDTL